MELVFRFIVRAFTLCLLLSRICTFFKCSYLELAARFIVRAFTRFMFAAFIRFGLHWVWCLWFIPACVRSSYTAGHCHATGYAEGDVHATIWDAPLAISWTTPAGVEQRHSG